MKVRMKTPLALATVAGTIIALGTAPIAGHDRDDAFEARTIYVNVMGGANGGPVLEGLAAGNFKVIEDNVERTVTGLAAATNVPVAAMLLIDTTRLAGSRNTIQDFRKAVVSFATQLMSNVPNSQVGFLGFGGQATVIQPLTTNLEDIQKMSTRIVANTDGGSLLNEGLVEASRVLSGIEGHRKIMIVVHHEPQDEYSQLPFPEVARAVTESGATLHVVAIVPEQKTDPGREELMKALTANTGGLRFTIGTVSNLDGLFGNVAFLQAVQYAVSYERPDGAGPATQTVVQVDQPGMRVLFNQSAGQR